MTTIYPLYSLYGNYLDGYYVKNYNDFISELMEGATEKLSVNLGITDGVTIINTLKGDFSGYNCAIVEREDGSRDLYKITDKQFVRRDIWLITMVLDCFSKYYTEVLESTVLVNRLGRHDFTQFDPMLFNNEGFSLSEVKSRQIEIPFHQVIKQKTGFGNLANEGYLLFFAKDTLKGSGTLKVAPTVISADITVSTISELEIYNKEYISSFSWHFGQLGGTNKSYIRYAYKCSGETLGTIRLINTYGDPAEITTRYESYSNESVLPEHAILGGSYPGTWDREVNFEQVYRVFNQYMKDTYLNGVEENIFNKYLNKIVYETSTGNYYRIILNTNTSTDDTQVLVNNTDLIHNAFSSEANYHSPEGIHMSYRRTYQTIYFEQQEEDDDSIEMPIPNLRNCVDQPFQIVFIPKYEFSPCTIPVFLRTSGSAIVSKDVIAYNDTVDRIVNQFIQDYGGENAKLLDVQYIYMNPIPTPEESDSLWYDYGNVYYMREVDEILKIDDRLENSKYNMNCIMYALDYADVEYMNNNIKIYPENFKIEQEYRYILRSPSGKSSYNFDVVRNGGLEGFTLKANFRPYASMYQVQPIYAGYYGSNFTDLRGLVVTEDMSVSQVSDLWEQYKRQNINYINSFESNQAYERSKLNAQQKYENEQFKLNLTQQGLNTILGGVGNMSKAGNSARGGYSISSVNYAIEGAQNTEQNAISAFMQVAEFKNYQEYNRRQLSLTQAEQRKQWQYSLQNIQALPLNTDKVSGIYTTNAKNFILEEYKPTEYEIEVYEKYLELYGITVGQVIDLTEYDFDYIEGNIIKFSTPITNEEYTELNDELIVGRRLYGSQEEKTDTDN